MSTKTYNLNTTGTFTASALDNTGTYESSDESTPIILPKDVKLKDLQTGDYLYPFTRSDLVEGLEPIYVGDGAQGGTQAVNADTIENKTLLGLVNMFYPVGSYFFSKNNVNPSTYMTGTTWNLVAEQIDVNGHVYGNGKGLAINDGSKLNTIYLNSNVITQPYNDNFNKDVGSALVSTGVILDNSKVIGVPTKAQIEALGTGYEDSTGLTTDTLTCYIFERTA